MDRRAFLRGAGTLAAPVVAGCAGRGDGGGGDGGDGGGASPTPTPGTPTQTTSTPTPAPSTPTTRAATTTGGGGAMAEYPNYDWEKLTLADAAETDTVTMRNTAYHPLVAKVDAGTEVAFPNEDPSVHTVTIPAMDVDELVRAGERTTVTFEEPGSFDYVCTFHPPGMLGRVVVE